MGNKRRKDKNHKIGDSAPGTVGDSKGTYHGDSNSPMANIHNRRSGELLSYEEVDEYLHPEKYEDESGSKAEHSDDQGSDQYDYQYGFPLTQAEKSALKYGHYWPEEKQREFLEGTDLTAEDLDWEHLA